MAGFKSKGLEVTKRTTIGAGEANVGRVIIYANVDGSIRAVDENGVELRLDNTNTITGDISASQVLFDNTDTVSVTGSNVQDAIEQLDYLITNLDVSVDGISAADVGLDSDGMNIVTANNVQDGIEQLDVTTASNITLIDINETNITQNTVDISKLQTDVSGLSGAIDVNITDIENLQTDVTVLSGAIDTNITNIENLQAQVDNISAGVISVSASDVPYDDSGLNVASGDDVQVVVESLDSELGITNTNLANLQTQVDNISAGVVSASASDIPYDDSNLVVGSGDNVQVVIESLDSAVDTNSTNITNLQTQVDGITSDLGNLTASEVAFDNGTTTVVTGTEVQTAIEELDTKFSNIDSTEVAFDEATVSISGSNVEEAIVSIDGKISDLTSDLNTLQASDVNFTPTVNVPYNDVQTAVSNIGDQVSSNNLAIAANQSDINDIIINIDDIETTVANLSAGDIAYTPSDLSKVYGTVPTNVQESLDGIHDYAVSSAAYSLSHGSTATISGGGLSVFDGTTITVEYGEGHIVDHTDLDNNSIPSTTNVSWNTQNVVVPDLVSTDFSYVFVNPNGTIAITHNITTPGIFRDKIFLGQVLHVEGTVIGVQNLQTRDFDLYNQLTDLARAIGPMNISGNIYSPANPGVNLTLQKDSGTTFRLNSNTIDNVKNPHSTMEAAQPLTSITRVYRDGSGGHEYVSGQTEIDTNQWDDGSGTLATIPNNNWTIQRVYMFSETGNTFVFYGQTLYPTLDDAVTKIDTENFTDVPEIFSNASLRAFVVVKKGLTDFSGSEWEIVNGNKFQGGTSGAGGGGVSISQFSDAEFSVYSNSDTAKNISFDLSNLNDPNESIVVSANIAQAGDINITLPSESGTLALTSEISGAGVTSLNGEAGVVTIVGDGGIDVSSVGGIITIDGANISGGSGTAATSASDVFYTPEGFIDWAQDGVPSNVQDGMDTLAKRSFNNQASLNLTNSTACISGGGFSYLNTTQITLESGIGRVVDYENLTPLELPTQTLVTWIEQVVFVPNLSLSDFSLLFIDVTGTPIFTQTLPNADFFRENIFLGKIIHRNNVINFVIPIPNKQVDLYNQYVDLARAIGTINVSGNHIQPANPSVDMSLAKTAGTSFRLGINMSTDVKTPHSTTEAAQDPISFHYVYRNGTGMHNYIFNETQVDPQQWDDGSGTLQALPNNRWTIQRCYMFPGTGTVYIMYGQAVYSSFDNAKEGINTEDFEDLPGNFFDASLRAYIITGKDQTDFSGSSWVIADGGKFQGSAGGGSGGGTTITTFSDDTFGIYYDSQPDKKLSFDLSALNDPNEEILISANPAQNGDINVELPSESGTLALTSDITGASVTSLNSEIGDIVIVGAGGTVVETTGGVITVSGGSDAAGQADGVTYTPSVSGDWETIGIPTNVQEALDNEASRSFDNEIQNSRTSSTTLLTGGTLTPSVSGTQFIVGEGTGRIVDYTVIDSFGMPSITDVSWPDTSAGTPGLIANEYTLVFVNSSGNVVTSTGVVPSNDFFRDNIFLGKLIHRDDVIDQVDHTPNKESDLYNNTFDIATSVGPITLEGNSIYPNNPSSTRRLGITAGKTYKFNGNIDVDPNNPHIVEDFGRLTLVWTYVYRDGSGQHTYVPSSVDLDCNNWDNGSGTLQAVPVGHFTIHTVYHIPGKDDAYVMYGQQTFETFDSAKRAVYAGDLIESVPEHLEGARLRAYIVTEEGTNVLEGTDWAIYDAGDFRNSTPRPTHGYGDLARFTDSQFGVYKEGSNTNLLSVNLASLSGSDEIVINSNSEQVGNISIDLPGYSGQLVVESDIPAVNSTPTILSTPDGKDYSVSVIDYIGGTEVADVSGYLQSQLDGISGNIYQGDEPCNTVDTVYNIEHAVINTDRIYPQISITTPVSGSIITANILDREADNFSVVLSTTPPTSGYSITWILAEGLLGSGTVPGLQPVYEAGNRITHDGLRDVEIYGTSNTGARVISTGDTEFDDDVSVGGVLGVGQRIQLNGSDFIRASNADLPGVSNMFVGWDTGDKITTGRNNTLLGHRAGENITSGSGNVCIGTTAGVGITNTSNSVAIGLNANARNNCVSIGRLSMNGYVGHTAIAIGSSTLRNTTTSNQVAIGHGAGNSDPGIYSVAIGNDALGSLQSNGRNVAVGYRAGFGCDGSDNVFIGFQAGNGSTESHRLYISNSNTTTPLIYGEFDNKHLTIHGDLTVNGEVTAISGATFLSMQTLEVSANNIVVNDGEIGAGVSSGTAGIEIDRGTETNVFMGWEEGSDTFQIGEVGGTLSSIATREDNPIDDGIMVWDGTNKQVKSLGVVTNTGTTVVPASGSQLIDSFDATTAHSASWLLSIDGTYGTKTTSILAAWNGSTVSDDQRSTVDIGDTSGLTLTVTENLGFIELTATSATITGGWDIKHYRELL